MLDVIEKPPGISEREKRFDENAVSRHDGKKYGTFAAMAIGGV
ncbi:hypothetical protein O7A60_02735 [Mesorhizobium sp. Ld1326N3]|uniref:Uncharacterized protein n=1 Tax=Mesorhizobium salmacidum TaxID=3015171 RepID=A0ABU8KS16_9HYPH